MRKSCYVLAAAAVLVLLGFGVMSAELLQKSKAVELEEEILYGDPSAAEDLTVSFLAQYREHLFWDTRVRPGQVPETQQKAVCSAPDAPGKQDAHLDASLVLNLSSSGNSLKKNDCILGGLYREMAEGLSAGEEKTQIVNLRDYQEFYPEIWNLSYPGHSYYGWIDEERPTNRIDTQLANYFRFSLPDELKIKAHASLDESGKYILTEMETVDGDEPRVFAYTASSEGNVWFVLDAREADNEPMDYQLVPGGFALYRLPLPEQGGPKIEELRPVLPLELSKEVQVLELSTAPDQKNIYLQTCEYGRCFVTVVDAQSGEMLQKLELGPYDGVDFVAENDFLVSVGTRLLQPEREPDSPKETELTLFLKEDDGNWKAAYTIPYNWQEEHLIDGKSRRMVLAPDKNRLAVAVELENQWPEDGQDGCSFGVQVLDQNGLVFAAKYHSSLDKAQTTSMDYAEKCLPSRQHYRWQSLCLEWDKPGEEGIRA